MSVYPLQLAILLLTPPAVAQTIIRVDDYGAVGDGRADDSPAIQRAVAAAGGKPTTVAFTTGKTYRLLTPHPGPGATAGRAGISVISVEGADGLIIDGQGAKLLLHPDVQFCFARNCSNLTIRGFEVDMAPLPFVPGEVVAVDAAGHSIDVRIAEGFDVPAADGTEMPNHPPFFGWLVATGDDGNIGHYFVQRLTPTGDARMVRLHAREQSFRQFEVRGIVLGTKVSVPVPGLAHVDRRFMQIDGCRYVTIADLQINSLPYFAFNFWRNEGRVRVSDVTIAPPQGTPRLTSAGRDGFHCKDNRAEMIFERCRLAGLRDDCFNISAMTAVPHERVSDTELIVKRTWYPNLGHAVFAKGDLVTLYEERFNRLYWCERVESAEDFVQGNLKLTRLRFAAKLPTLTETTLVHNEDVASPGAIVRDCDITGSCRLRSQMLIQDSTFTGFTWFTAEHVEGPFPRRVMIRNCHFINRDVRNNRGDCLMFALPESDLRGSRLRRGDEIVLQHNVFDGSVIFGNCEPLVAEGNAFNVEQRFRAAPSPIRQFIDNTLGGAPMTEPDVASSAGQSELRLDRCAGIFLGRTAGDTTDRHIAALGQEVDAWPWVSITAMELQSHSYQFQPSWTGQIGVEFDLDPRFTQLAFDTSVRGGYWMVFAYHRDGPRESLPILRLERSLVEFDKCRTQRVDLRQIEPEFGGRRRIGFVYVAGPADKGLVELIDPVARSVP